ncbi:MAG: undecaprenyl diphosphate synthase family protein [Methanomicrobiales archaeon]|nr:undecaprenyl diphosphate synthase family protein [Methanomicrobiales archaeon]MDI6877203.1 undecaprenyl diphosphate synthase family protein [Methanomicrobiales archaeon]
MVEDALGERRRKAGTGEFRESSTVCPERDGVPKFSRLPRHIGVIPDGNRRWAIARGLPRHAGYEKGIAPGFQLLDLCIALGIEELSVYGFTQDNTKRPPIQREAYSKACVLAVDKLKEKDAALLVVGNTASPMFPKELLPYTRRTVFGRGTIRVNHLINYSWQWDINQLTAAGGTPQRDVLSSIGSAGVSRIDLIIRWGGRRRLSGFLPVQSVYADIYVVDALWPDFRPEHLYQALQWYQEQDVTLGG